jgi:DNA-binding NtrC family response regulator
MELNNAKVLIVDDEPNAVKVLSAILSDEGYDIYKSLNVKKALSIVASEDLDMPDMDGMEFFEDIRKSHPDIPVIFLTAYGTVENAVYSMTNGAYYYFIKPPDYSKLKNVLSRAVEQRRLKRDIGFIKDSVTVGEHYRIIGNNPAMTRIFETIEVIRDTSSSVLITGETGTGKELIARALHFGSRRRSNPFITVNCAAIPRELMESELFGYERGAFTSAVSKRIGRFEEVAGGTLFLDEIGELELPLQSKLLRVLQERELERLGSNRKIKVDFRLVSSTNRDLPNEVDMGRFRKDLIYRINVVQINVPPLRERKEDIMLLTSEFVREFCARENKVLSISDEVARIFQDYMWPGNIRQLKNVVERAVVLATKSEITPKELPDELLCEKFPPAAALPEETAASMQTLKELEGNAVRNALAECKGNKSRAAKLLGISRKSFYKRLKETAVQAPVS